MNIRKQRREARVLSIFIIAISILASPVTAVWGNSVAAWQPPSDPALDLPAMSLTPPQLAAAGMPEYKLIGGELAGPRSLAYIAGKWTDQFLDDDIRATLESYGLQRAYGSVLRARQDPADIRSDLTHDLEVSLHEFTDPNGAAQALGLLDQLSAAYADVQRVQSTGPVTANAVLVRPTIEDPGDPRLLSVAWQVDRLVVVVHIYDYLSVEPTAQDAEVIAALMVPGIQAGFAGNTPGLGNMALRLEDIEFEELFEIRRDQYTRIGGQDYSYDLEDADTFARRVAEGGDALDVYAFSQFIQDIESVDPSLPFQFGWVTRLYEFADDQAASAWLAVQADRIETSYAGTDVSVQDLQVFEGAPTTGDESVSLTYIEQDDIPGRIFRTFLRVGNRTADIFLTSFLEEPFPDATIQALATVQAQCLARGCPDPILITDALAGQLPNATPQATGVVPSGSAPLDLAMVPLTPTDLAGLQMPGYAVGFGQMTYSASFIASTAESLGIPEDQVRATVDGSGFVRRYDSQLYLPADQSAPAGAVGRVVASYVLEFGDASGAASIFSFLEDESGNALARDIPMSAVLGDQSEATHETVMDAETGGSFDQIDVTFQWGRFQAGVAIIDSQGAIVQLADVEELAQQLFTRLQTASVTDATGLSELVLRMSGATVEPYSDQYLLAASQAIPQYGELAQDVQGRSDAAAAIGQTDEYEVQQYVAGGADVSENVWYLLHLMRFADETAATNWMAGLPGRIGGNPAFADVVFLDGPTVGDESVTYTLSSADGSLGYRGIAFRIGHEVALIDVNASTITNPLLLLTLADGQATCLAARECATPLAIPPGLL
ncbi:MAG TPA: hypothetical protein VFP05_13165 [Thermomicrobiales bacterium]|nr:hypothetical protein [Thermomicrobiales bacterium]